MNASFHSVLSPPAGGAPTGRDRSDVRGDFLAGLQVLAVTASFALAGFAAALAAGLLV